jgi:hypothetical protein
MWMIDGVNHRSMKNRFKRNIVHLFEYMKRKIYNEKPKSVYVFAILQRYMVTSHEKQNDNVKKIETFSFFVIVLSLAVNFFRLSLYTSIYIVSSSYERCINRPSSINSYIGPSQKRN